MLSACAEYEDFKSLYSMLPDLKSGRTLSKGTRSMRLAPPHSPCSQQTDGLRSSLLAFKTKWRKKGQQQLSPRQRLGGTDVLRLRPAGAKSFSLPSLGLCAVILLPFQGVIPAASFPAGRCPGLTYHCPFGALNCSGGYVIRLSWYPPPTPPQGRGEPPLTSVSFCSGG